MDNRLFPFYFPTTVILVDDNPNFLKSFSLLLNKNIAFQLFTSPRSALEHINIYNPISDILNKTTNVRIWEDTDEKICINTDLLHNYVYNNNRFSQISVLIVDYAMPEMNGIEFCQNIKNSKIKRILLTGKADEKIAVKAFNEGLIDRFMLKISSGSEIDAQINNAIMELQNNYFYELTKPFYHPVIDKKAPFMADIEFQDFFSRLVIEKNCVEYYLWDQPNGVILLDPNGKLKFLFITTKEALDTHYEIALSAGAPTELLEIITAGEHVIYFSNDDGFYSPDFLNWKDCIYPIDFVCGYNDAYLCAFVSPSPVQELDTTKIRTYCSYLDQLDSKIDKL